MSKSKNINTIKEDLEEIIKDEQENSISAEVNARTKTKMKKRMKLNDEEELQKNKNIEKMLQSITESKKIPKDTLKKIYTEVFINIVIAIAVMTYLFFIILGSKNIEKNIYEVDLRVFSGCLFLVAIFLIEFAYKKQNIKLTIHSIELLVFSMCNLFFLFFYTKFTEQYKLIIGGISLLFCLYYTIKSIVVFILMKNRYYKTMSDVSEILNKNYNKEEA